MGKIINFEEALRRKSFDRALSQMIDTSSRAYDVANSYYQLMQKSPSIAIDKLDEFMEKVRDINPERCFVEAVAGGPNHDWTAPMLDIVGIMYPTLDRELRTKSLIKCMSFLDGLRYDYSQNHVELINEPWLVADIVISRDLYWCGYQDYIALLNKHKDWDGLRKDSTRIKSDFWLTYALVKPEYSSLDIRYNYYKTYPELVDRTLDGIAGILATRSELFLEKKGTPILESYEKYLSKIDTILHDRILSKIEENKWIKLSL